MDREKLWKFFEEELFKYNNPNFFNQYNEIDPDFDKKNGNEIRRNNLRNYINSIKNPRFLLVGEAPGFKGMRCSGVPFVCEEQLVKGSLPFIGEQSTNGQPKCEITVKEYWKVILPYHNLVINWDAIPFHLFNYYNKAKNRAPKKSELQQFLPYLKQVIDVCKPEKIIAIGKKPLYSLNELGINAIYLRHPSFGGKKNFSNKLNKIFKTS